MADIDNQKFTLKIKGADFRMYNGKEISLEDFLTSFSKIIAEKGIALSYSIRSKGWDWMTLESNDFPAANIIALFASPLKMLPRPYFIVGNDSCAFSNNQDLKFYIPELQGAFRNMHEIEKVLSQKGKDPITTKVVVIRYLDPTKIPTELPQCRIGNPGIYNNGSVIRYNSIVNSYLSETAIKVKDPIDEVFYIPVWKSLDEIYANSENTSEKSKDYELESGDEDEFDPDFVIEED